MNTQDDKTKPYGFPLTRIYQTDPFGFPLHADDEEIYRQEMEMRKADLIPKDAIPEKDRSPMISEKV